MISGKIPDSQETQVGSFLSDIRCVPGLNVCCIPGLIYVLNIFNGKFHHQIFI